MKKFLEKNSLSSILLIVVFSILTSISQFMNGDDYLWYFSANDSELEAWTKANGRLFSNQMTMLLCRNIPFRTIFVAVSFALFLILLSKLFDFDNVTKGGKYCLALTFFILIPPTAYAESVVWISGYTNYIFSMVLLFLYIYLMFRSLFSDKAPALWNALLYLPLALFCGLCVEHITIYSVILAILMVVLAVKLKKKCLPHALMYLLGAVISCVLMFSDPTYGQIAGSGDMVGDRYFEIGFSNVLQNAFSFVVPHYTKDYWIIPIVITVAFTLLYVKNDFEDKKPKYMKLCLSICWGYSVYSIFTTCFSNFRIFSPAMRIIALETAFSFIYIVSIAYLISVFMDRNKKIRAYTYLVSTFLLTAPFVFISPATARCFLANNLFWILLCGEVVTAALKTVDVKYLKKLNPCIFVLSSAAASLILFICLSNKYVNTLRYNYIKEQVQDKENKLVELILLPYTEYSHEDLEEGLFADGLRVGDFGYNEFILKYHGIEYDGVTKYTEVKISPYDYFVKDTD